jgi:hypothetical protein
MSYPETVGLARVRTSAASYLYSEFRRTSGPTSTRYVPRGDVPVWETGPVGWFRATRGPGGYLLPLLGVRFASRISLDLESLQLVCLLSIRAQSAV